MNSGTFFGMQNIWLPRHTSHTYIDEHSNGNQTKLTLSKIVCLSKMKFQYIPKSIEIDWFVSSLADWFAVYFPDVFRARFDLLLTFREVIIRFTQVELVFNAGEINKNRLINTKHVSIEFFHVVSWLINNMSCDHWLNFIKFSVFFLSRLNTMEYDKWAFSIFTWNMVPLINLIWSDSE